MFWAVLLMMAAALPLSAQSGGDFCVRAFEDRNGNGARETGDAFEPLLRSGIGADLLNEQGVIVASALLAESPTADQGVICFQFLPDGQYTIQITSAEYRPTTADTMTATITSGALPSVMELGVQSLVAAQPVIEAPVVDEDAARLERILFAAAGAIGVALVLQLLGIIIYFIRFGRRRKAAEPQPDPGATGKFKRPN